MSDFKDLYIECLEERARELRRAGMNPDAAYDLASNDAYERARDRLADRADMLRQREKDGEL